MAASARLAAALLLAVASALATLLAVHLFHPSTIVEPDGRRRLTEAASSPHPPQDIEHVLSLATRPPEDAFTEGEAPFRVLFIVTTLAEYDKGMRGTKNGAE